MDDVYVSASHEYAWNYLMEHIGNENAVAGIMGYFQALTEFNPMHGFYKDGAITKTFDRDSFITDKKEYGIGAWNKWYDKQSLWNISKRDGYPISGIECQIDLFIRNLTGISENRSLLDALKLADNPEDAGEIMYNIYLPQDKRNEDLCRSICDYAHLLYAHFVRPKRIVRYVKIQNEEAWVRARPFLFAKKVFKAGKNEMYHHVASSKNGKWHSIYFEGGIRWIQASAGSLLEREESYG